MRLHQIDALRGFALFGILMVNIFVFHAPYAYYGQFYGQFTGTEKMVLDNMIFFFGGKFMFIYAFLFGYSFWLQYQKWQDKQAFRRFWNRRMWLLAGFGVLHILLLSFGDILLPYALLGLSLPFFARLRLRWILLSFLLIYLIPVYEFVLRGFFDFPSVFMQPVTELDSYIEINRQGSALEIFGLRLRDYFSLVSEKLVMYMPKEISLFLVGMLAGRAELANKIKVRHGLLFCVFAVLVVGGMYFYRPNLIAFFDYKNSVIQRTVLGLAIHFYEFMHGGLYIVGFFLLWKLPLLQKALWPLTYTGKLSLTNYIGQSLICLILFSGLDYYGQLTPSQLVVWVLVIYAAQLVCSILWLRYYQQGPLEHVWRKYSKRGG